MENPQFQEYAKSKGLTEWSQQKDWQKAYQDWQLQNQNVYRSDLHGFNATPKHINK